MTKSLKNICNSAHQNKHRQPLPGYENTYKFYRHSEGFIYFISNQLPFNKISDGWKFSISVHNDDVQAMWSLIAPLLLTPKGSLAFKILDITTDNYQNYAQFGKQITLFTFKTPDEQLLQAPQDLLVLLKNIEHTMRLGKIRPGPITPADRKISGSRYISIRNDLAPVSNIYISTKMAQEINPQKAYNPFNHYDPYCNFTVCTITNNFFRMPITDLPQRDIHQKNTQTLK